MEKKTIDTFNNRIVNVFGGIISGTITACLAPLVQQFLNYDVPFVQLAYKLGVFVFFILFLFIVCLFVVLFLIRCFENRLKPNESKDPEAEPKGLKKGCIAVVIIISVLLVAGISLLPSICSTPSSVPSTVWIPPDDSPGPNERDIDSVKTDKKYPNDVVAPKADSYLSSYKIRYVKSDGGHSIYLFWASECSADQKRNHYVYEGDAVTVLAREGNASFIIYMKDGKYPIAGWVVTKDLSKEPPKEG